MSDRLSEYSVREAAEYLERLEEMLGGPPGDDADELLRLAAGVRGSAQMADVEPLASLAQRLEDAARERVASDSAWDDELQELAVRTVAELKELIHRIDGWGADEERRAREAIARWDEPRAAAAEPDEPIAIAELFYDDDGPHVVQPRRPEPTFEESRMDDESGGGGEEPIVPIDDLLYRGERALREAIALRPLLEQAARGEALPERPLGDVVDELFDLLDLAVEPEPADA